ncbi:MAG: acyl-CoA dehydrogenase family protein, partial [Solirubrobacterales bacterium]
MDFAFNDEQLEYRARCRKFAAEVIRPAARKHDEEESIPWEVIKEARKQGFGGLEGIQRSASDSEGQMQVISAEEFHWGCAGIALAISGSGLA